MQTIEQLAVPGDHARLARWTWWFRWRPWVVGFISVVLALALLHELRGLLHEVRYEQIVASVQATPWSRLGAAFAFTAVSFLALSRYDTSALRYVQVHLKQSTVLLTSFIAYALGNTIGLGVLTGGAVRMRLYSAAGLEAAKIGAVIAFNAGAFGLGMVVCGAVGLWWGAAEVAQTIGAAPESVRTGALLVTAASAAFIGLCAAKRRVRLGQWQLALPSAFLVLQQLAISIVDLAASGAVLWVLFPPDTIGWATFSVFYVAGVALGVISHVPGGIGIFEATILLATAGRAPPEQIASALVLYRVIYYFVPLMFAAVLLAGYELRAGSAAPVGRAAIRLSPLVLAALCLLCGVVLLISGVTPATDDSADLLALRLPLPIVEAAHFLGSVAGVGMLFVARGLLVRLDAAWWAAVLLSAVTAVLAIPKGIALSEAVLLSSLVVLLIISRRQFDRSSTLFAMTLEPGWWISIALILASCIWLMFFVYRDIGYAHQLWWQFEFDAHAPRSLRALVGVALTVLAVGLWQLLRAPTGRIEKPSAHELSLAREIVAAQDSPDACICMMGDKSLLFSDSGKAFLMFGKRGRTWAALFDPIGPQSEWPELIWRFIEMSHTHGGRVAFYQVRPSSLSHYLDAGLRAFKLGEAARLPLASFSLKGTRRAGLRQSVNRAERASLTFEVISAEELQGCLPELRAVSDAWLAAQHTQEKAFSLGAFRESYILCNPVALIRQSGTLVAFATLLTTATRREASIDLMRHTPNAPAGSMDFLLVRLIQYFQSLGFQYFDLGMAPLAGMTRHELAPRWHRWGRIAFERGGHFYNFRGLRAFKQKFDPVWEPRYLVTHGGIAPLFVLADIAALISGGFRGVIGK
jgi:phosphatidylglycerol lysyltransferase